MNLSLLKPRPGSRKRRKRLGCGVGSGHGKTSGKGHKGHSARSGGGKGPGFEGGQMPLIRRIPKRGFTNVFRRPYEVVHLKDLAGFGKGETVTPERLREKGLIHGDRVKVLSDGALTHSLTVHAHAFSQKAKGLIEKAGGKAEVIASHV